MIQLKPGTTVPLWARPAKNDNNVDLCPVCYDKCPREVLTIGRWGGHVRCTECNLVWPVEKMNLIKVDD